MSLRFLVNTAEAAAVKLSATNTANAEVTPGPVYNLAGGQRHVSWTSPATGVRTVNYVNLAGTLAADTVVVAGAASSDGKYFAARSYSAYPGTSAVAYSTTLSSYVGKTGRDFVASFAAVSRKQALGAQFGRAADGDDSGGFTAAATKVYFASAYTLNYPGRVVRQLLPRGTRVAVHRTSYPVDEQWTVEATDVTRAELRAFQGLHKLKQEPLFVWDASGLLVRPKLLHALVVDYAVQNQSDDRHALSVTLATLNQWG